MNNYDDLPDFIPSDVDIAIDWETFRCLDSIVIELAGAYGVGVTQKIWHGYHKCAYILSPLNIEKYFFLQLDFFVDFSGRGFPNLFPIEAMLSGKRRYKNFYIPAAEVEVPFLLQRRIFKGDIKESHVENLARLYSVDNGSVRRGIIMVFGDEVGASLCAFIESADLDQYTRNFGSYRKKLRQISRQNTSLSYRANYILAQAMRALYRLRYPTGISVGFVGGDKVLVRQLTKKFDEIVSGSFHGTTLIETSSVPDYLKKLLFSAYWSKVTKRKVLIKLQSSRVNWEGIFGSELLNRFIPKPDVVLYLHSDGRQSRERRVLAVSLNGTEDLKTVVPELVRIVLGEQVRRTEKHLMDMLSPTSN